MSEFLHFISSLWAVWILLFSVIIYLVFKRIFKTFSGEKSITTLFSSLPKDKYIVLANLNLNNVRNLEKIDYLLVSVYGVAIISNKTMTGWVDADADKEKWVLHSYGETSEFDNPVLQGKAAERAVKELLGTEKPRAISLTAFAGSCRLRYKGDHSSVVSYSGLLKHLRKALPEEVIAFDEAERIAKLILEQSTPEQKGRSVAELRKKLEEKGISAFQGDSEE